jgi:hypothetical protein
MALGFWLELQFSRSVSFKGTFQNVSFLGFCFFGLIFGAIPALIFGWILRRLMKLLPNGKIWLWIAAGAVLGWALIFCLGTIGQVARDPRYLPYSALPIWPFLLVGPLTIFESSIWIAIPVGGATAAVLFAVHTAFVQKASE